MRRFRRDIHGRFLSPAGVGREGDGDRPRGQIREERLDRDVALQGVRQGVENRIGEEPFVGGDETQVSAGELGKGPPGNRPDQRRQSRRAKGVGQPGGVAFRTAVVRHDAGKVKIRLEVDESLHERGDAPPHPVDVHDEENGGVEPAGDLGRAPLVACGIRPVEEPHDPLDEGAVGVRRGPFEEAADMLLPGHPAVQVVAGPAGGEGEVGRVEEVRSHLEGLDGKPRRVSARVRASVSEVFPEPLCVPAMTSVGQRAIRIPPPFGPSGRYRIRASRSGSRRPCRRRR